MSGSVWTDWQQDKRLEAAEDQLDAERRARNRLAQQVREQQGNLAAQIERLTRAFVALVEHEDIRAELGQYADAAAVRRYAREVVSTVVVTGGAALRGTLEPADVPGYWLAAAARGVAKAAQDDRSGEALLGEAERRDPQRTATFLTMLDALTREARWSGATVARALPDRGEVTQGQRQVWLAIADGRIDRAAADTLAERLGGLVSGVGAPAVEAVAAWLRAEGEVAGSALSAEAAEQQLNALRRVLVSGVRPPADPPRPITILGADADEEAPEADPQPEDPLADCLRSLVDEGSPAEGDILARMAMVRAEMGFLDEQAVTMAPAWSAPAGDVVDLLLEDLAQPVDSGRHALARRALAPILDAVADQLARTAAEAVPERRTFSVAATTIAVTAEGATEDWRPAVAQGFARLNPERRELLPAGVGLLVAGVVSSALTFLATGWLVLGVLLVAAGLVATVAALNRRRELRQQHEATVTRAGRQVDELAAVIRDEQARSATSAVNAEEHRRAVKELLAAG